MKVECLIDSGNTMLRYCTKHQKRSIWKDDREIAEILNKQKELGVWKERTQRNYRNNRIYMRQL